MHKVITSVNNNLIKEILILQEKSRERKHTQTFITEGLRELTLALKGGYLLQTLLYCDKIAHKNDEMQTLLQQSNEIINISEEVYQRIAYRSTTEGVVGILKSKNHSLEQFKLNKNNTLILVAEAPEKPGNIGALLRTADAAGIDGVIIANPQTDLYNPNVIRSSVGCLFTQNIAVGTTQEVIKFLKTNNIKIFSAALIPESINYLQADFTASTAIVVGTEDKGLHRDWLDNSYQNIIIPMRGEIDSMNVSVAAAVLVFEAVRQRIIRLTN